MTFEPAPGEAHPAQAATATAAPTAPPAPPATPPGAQAVPPGPPAKSRQLSIGLASLFAAVALVVGGSVGFIVGHTTGSSPQDEQGTGQFGPGMGGYGGFGGYGRGGMGGFPGQQQDGSGQSGTGQSQSGSTT